jgi:hypothetical protein
MLGNTALLETYAHEFRVELDVLEYWMNAWLGVLANALQYQLEADPDGLARTFLDMYMVAVKECGEHVIRQGYDLSRRNFGDEMLALEPTSDKREPFMIMLAKKRADGVRDEDIRDWWNNHPIVPALRIRIHTAEIDFNVMRLTRRHGLTPEQAQMAFMRRFPVFGNPDGSDWATGDDRLLFVELSSRVYAYYSARTREDPEALEQDINRSSSFNALVRREMRTGRLYRYP